MKGGERLRAVGVGELSQGKNKNQEPDAEDGVLLEWKWMKECMGIRSIGKQEGACKYLCVLFVKC
jgi:hypothetical protein